MYIYMYIYVYTYISVSMVDSYTVKQKTYTDVYLSPIITQIGFYKITLLL